MSTPWSTLVNNTACESVALTVECTGTCSYKLLIGCCSKCPANVQH